MSDKNIVERTEQPPIPAESPFASDLGFEAAARAAKALYTSTLVPEQFQGPRNAGNCFIALEMANRLKVSPLAIMQSLHVVRGKPAFSGQFLISLVNSCGRFSPLRFRFTGEGKDLECVAYARDLESGETVEGPPVSLRMAEQEGWLNKSGSKWRTMPRLMLMYRAGAFFSRVFAPDIAMGFLTLEEVRDIQDSAKKKRAAEIMEKIEGGGE